MIDASLDFKVIDFFGTVTEGCEDGKVIDYTFKTRVPILKTSFSLSYTGVVDLWIQRGCFAVIVI